MPTLKRKKFPADLVTFTEEILNGKLHFLCSVSKKYHQKSNRELMLCIFNIVAFKYGYVPRI